MTTNSLPNPLAAPAQLMIESSAARRAMRRGSASLSPLLGCLLVLIACCVPFSAFAQTESETASTTTLASDGTSERRSSVRRSSLERIRYERKLAKQLRLRTTRKNNNTRDAQHRSWLDGKLPEDDNSELWRLEDELDEEFEKTESAKAELRRERSAERRKQHRYDAYRKRLARKNARTE